MQDHYLAQAASTSQFPLPFVTQFLPGATDQSSLYSTDNEKSGTESRDKRSALVVDDVADVTDMLSVFLTHAGYRVVTASSAPAALEAARQRQFDVVISDIGMPEMNGYQLASALRLLPGYQTVPMVAVTGYSMFDDKQQSMTAGFNAHMTKPIDPQALLNLIEQL
jgi:CheY-like chemotaxis protein